MARFTVEIDQARQTDTLSEIGTNRVITVRDGKAGCTRSDLCASDGLATNLYEPGEPGRCRISELRINADCRMHPRDPSLRGI